MASLPLRQSDAAKWTRVAWAATALAGAGAMLIFVLPKPAVKIDPNALGQGEPIETPVRERVHPTDTLGEQRWAAISDTMLALQDQQPELEQWWRTRQAILDRQRAEAEANAPTENGEVVAGQPFAPTWRFIGLIWNGRKPLAILAVDMQQRLVGVGDKPVPEDQFVVESIDADKVIVSRGRSRYEIKRETVDHQDLLSGANAAVDPNAGVFDEQTGVGRRVRPGVRPNQRNNPR